GTPVETVDERNVYQPTLFASNVGFSFSLEGRGLLWRQTELRKTKKQPEVGNDAAAAFILYGEIGPAIPPPDASSQPLQVLSDHNAMTRRDGPWFACLSAYHTSVSQSRWYPDRQNLLSVFHDKTGLIVGGGSTKLQPLWSTFTVGDVSLLR